MEKQYVLILNCGSSSIKFALIHQETENNILNGVVQNIGADESIMNWRYKQGQKQERILSGISYTSALESIIKLMVDEPYSLGDKIFAIGHRVVHGGEYFTNSTIIDANVLKKIKLCSRLAPLHNPANIAGIESCQKAFPTMPQVAVFDTAFHQTIPAHAYIYAIPYELYSNHGVRRYGFHGTSHRFVSAQAIKSLNLKPDDSALISAHLGNGCSADAILNGESVDCTLGLTPLEGLVMGTRSGDVDPGLHVYLADNLGYDVHKVTDLLNKQSGLLGLSGKSDMRDIEEAISKGDERAILAAEIFCYRLAKYISAFVVPLRRLDALIFTGGIGENSDFIRAKTLGLLEFLGFKLDAKRNLEHGRKSFGIITADGSKTAIVIPTNEELLIAQDTAKLVHGC